MTDEDIINLTVGEASPPLVVTKEQRDIASLKKEVELLREQLAELRQEFDRHTWNNHQ